MNAIELSHVGKAYRDFALQDVNLSLPCGGILGLVGENGAGKSTTIKLIMNAVHPDSGQITVLGTDTRSEAFDAIKEDIGVVLDEAYFPEVLTAKNVGGIMKNTYTRWDERQYEQYLKDFRLPDNKMFKDFSRGMKMKLAIAVALSHNPKLLILDEATSGLDPIVRDEILDIFNEFTRDETHSVLLSSHIVSDLEKICDYVAFIHNGRLLFCEEKDRLLEEYALLKVTKEVFQAVPPEAVVGKKVTDYDVEALVRRAAVSEAFPTEHGTLEDIILMMARGDGQQ